MGPAVIDDFSSNADFVANMSQNTTFMRRISENDNGLGSFMSRKAPTIVTSDNLTRQPSAGQVVIDLSSRSGGDASLPKSASDFTGAYQARNTVVVNDFDSASDVSGARGIASSNG